MSYNCRANKACFSAIITCTDVLHFYALLGYLLEEQSGYNMFSILGKPLKDVLAKLK